MRRPLFPGLLLLSLVLGLGCGPAADLWLRVEAPFVVPGECDSLLVHVEQTKDGAQVYQRSFPLASAQQFPVTLSLYTQDAKRLAPAALRVTVTAQLRGTAVAAPGSAEVTLHDDQVTQVLIKLARLSSLRRSGQTERAVPGHASGLGH